MFNVISKEQLILENHRKDVSQELDPIRRAELGQYMTPYPIAFFMASLFTYTKEIRLLDPGAGMGSLTSAFIESALEKGSKINVEVWEIDPTLRKYLENSLELWKSKSKGRLVPKFHKNDFIEDACYLLSMGGDKYFTHAILNPPYKKINSKSKHRHFLSEVGIETVNLYSAFIALSINLLAQGGQLVAIIPRSFCNGTYYKPFRQFLLNNCSIKRIHLFNSRTSAFKDDRILQENIIIYLIKNSANGRVTISTSENSDFAHLKTNEYDYSSIVDLQSEHKYIHIPISESDIHRPAICTHKLSEIGLEVSTGPVVDFRLKEYLKDKIDKNTIPLIYPHNFINGTFQWPRKHKKPNGIKSSSAMLKWLMPKGNYVLVKRFSSKEEKKRISAYYLPSKNIQTAMVGIENHLNVFHYAKRGIDELLAKGLTLFLNSKIIDDHFRVFSGHTQVNATDLRTMRYPSREILIELGKKSLYNGIDQSTIDKLIREVWENGQKKEKN
jgi:adenine-specific DNA-methyltransferase